MVGLLCLVIASAGGVWYWQSQRPVVATPQEAPSSPSPVPPGKGEAVLIESLPPHAKVLLDGKEVAETPHPFVLQAGEKVTVKLAKDGYVSQTVDLDLGKGKKVLVRLEKDKDDEMPAAKPAAKFDEKPPAKGDERPPPPPVSEDKQPGRFRPGLASKLPRPPPVAVVVQPTPTPVPTPTPTLTPTPVPKKTVRAKDPYERLDEKKGSEIMNPY